MKLLDDLLLQLVQILYIRFHRSRAFTTPASRCCRRVVIRRAQPIASVHLFNIPLSLVQLSAFYKILNDAYRHPYKVTLILGLIILVLIPASGKGRIFKYLLAIVYETLDKITDGHIILRGP